ncbi:hypothetical protein PENTCL1PPCAC_9081, partial [Pristionchus entomophagus]
IFFLKFLVQTYPTCKIMRGRGRNNGIHSSSTDIVHVKLWRPQLQPNLIKMRNYYKDGSAFGKSCQIDIGPSAAKLLDGPLEVLAHQGAVLLHIQMV